MGPGLSLPNPNELAQTLYNGCGKQLAVLVCSLDLNKPDQWDFGQLPKILAKIKKCGGSGKTVDPSAHPQHVNDLKTFYMFGVDMETIPCGSGTSTNAP
jgi:hypothetical protein